MLTAPHLAQQRGALQPGVGGKGAGMLEVEGTEPEIHILILAAHPAAVIEGAHLQPDPLFGQQAAHGVGTLVELQMLVEAGKHQSSRQLRRCGQGRGQCFAPVRKQAEGAGPAPLQLGGDPPHQGNRIEQLAEPLSQGGLLQGSGTIVLQQEVAARLQLRFAAHGAELGAVAPQLQVGLQPLRQFRQHPDIDLVEQGAQAEVVVKRRKAKMQGIVHSHPVRTGAHRLQGKARLPLELSRQNGRHRLRQQVGQPGIRAVEIEIQRARPGALQPLQMGEQRAIPQGQQTLHHIFHHQLATVVKTHRRAQVETPVAGAQRLPVVGEIPFDFPIFLISPGEAVEDLATQVDFGAAHRAGGQQLRQRPVVGYSQDLAPLAGGLTELFDQQRSEQIEAIFGQAHRLRQLALTEQIPQPAPGQALLTVEQGEPGAPPPPCFRRPAEPALILHPPQQQTGVAWGAAEQIRHLGEADLPLVAAKQLGESLKLLVEATGRHKRGNPVAISHQFLLPHFSSILLMNVRTTVEEHHHEPRQPPQTEPDPADLAPLLQADPAAPLAAYRGSHAAAQPPDAVGYEPDR